ncbi:hypothetical protein BJ138DRAFT_1157887 [Hygrophoropsis aurantiaca]|uniref:Uncharacterized protein n=1 Tax=Hygrophoropsis aurantiaca TaxID=72124 RepID=A0ACB8A5H3_9AGAM|nr:hypothetical protein BJ138DRAFT_1157887 [Hygrophoropsis aurantiaca]
MNVSGAGSEDIYVDAQTLRAVYALQLSTYTALVGMSILAYDYMLTYELERKYLWPARWTIIKCLYIFNRYIPFVDSALVLTRVLTPGLDLNTCYVLMELNCWFYTIAIGMAEIILMICTWAVWARRRAVGILLVVIFLAFSTPAYWTTADFGASITFGPPPLPNLGCMVTHNNATIAGNWVLLIMIELCVLILMVIKTLRDYKENPGMTLSKVILRDGIAYYINLFALGTINVIIILTQPHDLYLLFAVPVRIIHSVLTSRVVLRTREYGQRLEVNTNGVMEIRTDRVTVPPTDSLVFAPVGVGSRQSWVDGYPSTWPPVEEVELDVTPWWNEDRARRNIIGRNGARDQGGNISMPKPSRRKGRDRCSERVTEEDSEMQTDDSEGPSKTTANYT